MEQVAHQAVAMQFILEMARSSQQDPRGCFRQFFHKAKVSKRKGERSCRVGRNTTSWPEDAGWNKEAGAVTVTQ